MYIIQQLLKYQLVHAFSTRADGNMAFFYGNEDVLLHRRIFLNKTGISGRTIVLMKPPHRLKIQRVTKDSGSNSLKWPEILADGLLTTERNLFLALLPADCLPLIVFEPAIGILGLVHVGWRNAGIIGRMVVRMRKLGAVPGNLVVAIGPSIRKESYVVPPPIIQEKNPAWLPFLLKQPDGRTAIDLAGFAVSELRRRGVSEIYLSEVDTAQDRRFFSHYRDKDTPARGRFICVVGLPK